MMKVATVLLLVFLWKVSAAEEYVITRLKQDIFKIPTSMCSNISQKCKKMGAIKMKRTNCKCQCNVNNTHNVFGFFDNTWKCESNEDVRFHSVTSCAVQMFKNREVNSPLLLAVPPKPNDNPKYIGEVAGIDASMTCDLQDTFSYLDCYNNWKPTKNAQSIFLLTKYEGRFYLDATNTFDKLISGRVLTLNITCKDESGDTISPTINDNCVRLKTQGKLPCRVLTLTTSRTPSSSSAISILSSSSPSTPTMTMRATSMVTSSFSQQPTSAYSTLESTASFFSSQIPPTSIASIYPSLSQSTISHTTLAVPSTRRPSTQVITQSTKSPNTTETFQNDGKKGAITADNTSIIAGTVGGIVALIVIIMILIIRKKRNTATDRGPEKVDDVYEEPVDNHLTHTGQQPSTEEDYDYTYTNYLPFAKRKNDIATRQISVNSNRAYDHSPPIPEAPVYNTLEDPDYVKSEPVYNVLEGPEAEGATHEAPVYAVLEGPVPGDAPVYDVLEGPDDQHVYGSLEAQDPHLYGSLNSPDGRDEVNPSSKGGGIYQELNQAGRQSPGSEYQPLGYPRISMDMNKLTDEQSRA